MKRLVLTLVALLAMPAAVASEPANEITPANVLDVMNLYRAGEGLPPLALDSRLTLAAGDRMRHMEEAGFWAHQSPDGISPFVWLHARAYRYRFAGENLAAGFETAKLLVESWMESPGHRANILSADYDECGIAIIDGATTGRATGRSVVVLFATD